MADLKDRLRAKALDLGFAAMGVCAPGAVPDLPQRLRGWLEAGAHGQMAWMEDRPGREGWRSDPQRLWPEVRSIVMLAEPYTPAQDPLAVLGQPDRGAISVYAQGRDYHDLVKKRLKHLGRWLIDDAGGEIKVFVDTAPVMEKPLAAAAGLGWQGKHTNLLGRDLGNWIFLGALFTTLELAPDAPSEDHCGSCTACIEACPTRALVAPYRLDARLCVAYLTIEHHGPVDPALRPMLGNRIFGCDDCLAVCPWNKFAATAREARYAAPDPTPPRLADLAGLDEAAFAARFSGTPVRRLGRNRLIRNVLYAIGNSGQPDLAPAARPHLSDPDPMVAEAARWALARLGAPSGAAVQTGDA
jgi:epoxyqueuosine reductase